MTGMCPICRQPFLPGATACAQPSCPGGPRLFAEHTILNAQATPPPAQVFTAATQIGSTPTADQTLRTGGLTISGYEIVREIGRGGMGFVLEARQLSLDRRVAVKVLPPNLATNQDFVLRFQRESVTLARLSHPNIVTVIDRGQSGAFFYFVMEFVKSPEGDLPHDLRQLIRSRQLDARTTHRLILQVVRALHYAHQQGVIHRDIKPTNILLDHHHNARITDFGIAAVLADIGTDRQLTAANVGMGTGDYMAPEQRFDAAGIDHRADIYSTGVMLYEMLTGARPTFDYQPPSRAVPGLNVGWDAIVACTLKTLPQDRFADMAAFAAALEALDPATASAAPSLLPVPEAFTAVTAQVQHTPLPTGTAGISCLDCTKPIRATDIFCPHCGLTTTPECPLCGVRTPPGQRYCSGCRTDIQKAPRFEAYRQQGNQLLSAAEKDGSPADRAGQAEKALGAFQAALQLFADNRGVVDLISRTRHLLLRLLVQAGDAALQQKNVVQARGFYQRVLAEQPDHPLTLKRLQEFDKQRNLEVVEASELLNKGHFGPATQTLERLLRRYPADRMLEQLLRSTRQHEVLLKQTLENTVPRLETERRYVEMLRVLLDLQRRNLEVPPARLETCRKQLAVAKDLLQGAVEAEKQDDPNRARQLAKKTLQIVADHPVALQMVGLGPDGKRLGKGIRRKSWGIGRFLLRTVIRLTVLGVLGLSAWIGWQVYLTRTEVKLSPPSGAPPTWFWHRPPDALVTLQVPSSYVTVEPFKIKELEGTRYHAVPQGAEKDTRSYHAFQAKFARSVDPTKRLALAGAQTQVNQILGLSSSTVETRPLTTPTWARSEFIYRCNDGRICKMRYFVDRSEGTAYYFWVMSSVAEQLQAEEVDRFFDSIQLPWVRGRE